MAQIKVTKPSQEELNSLGVKKWHFWECNPSRFEWIYIDEEVCYILEGKARVRSSDGEAQFCKGDLVKFPKGLKCEWEIIEKIEKVYKMG